MATVKEKCPKCLSRSVYVDENDICECGKCGHYWWDLPTIETNIAMVRNWLSGKLGTLITPN